MVEAQQRNLAGLQERQQQMIAEQERRKRDTLRRCLIKNKQSWRVQLKRRLLLQISARLSRLQLLKHGKLNRREKRKKRNAKQKQQRGKARSMYAT